MRPRQGMLYDNSTCEESARKCHERDVSWPLKLHIVSDCIYMLLNLHLKYNVTIFIIFFYDTSKSKNNIFHCTVYKHEANDKICTKIKLTYYSLAHFASPIAFRSVKGNANFHFFNKCALVFHRPWIGYL